MSSRHESAVVLGASMSGLLAARVLSDRFDSVTVVERDALPAGAEVRKGVPQGAHAHGLLASGYRVLDGYFPELMNELRARGVPYGDATGDFLWFQYGRWKLRHESGLRGITASRPCLETAVRRHVAALRNVTILEGTVGLKPTFDPRACRVTGLSMRRRDGSGEAALDADLVVDASGRGSQSSQWLEEWELGRPVVRTVKVDVGYATRQFERRPGEFFDSMGAIVSATPPASSRFGAVLGVEGGRWIVTLGGSQGDHPPTDETGWVGFAASLPVPVVYDLVTSARPLTPIVSYRFSANRRLLYEKMRRFPAGYLVIGDALCSFNPIYGQGMSVAAMEARALDEALANGLDGVARRFYARARKIVDIPWTIATSEDLRFPQAEGPRPPGFHLVNRYLERVHAMASHDARMCRRFFDVLNLLAPPSSLMTPAVALRVLRSSVRRDQGSPWGAGAAGAASSRAGTDPRSESRTRTL